MINVANLMVTLAPSTHKAGEGPQQVFPLSRQDFAPLHAVPSRRFLFFTTSRGRCGTCNQCTTPACIACGPAAPNPHIRKRAAWCHASGRVSGVRTHSMSSHTWQSEPMPSAPHRSRWPACATEQICTSRPWSRSRRQCRVREGV
jgi:hypothetical protein